MQKINFQNLPNTTTPINETNLNSLQTNVEGAFSGTKGTSAVDTYNQQFLNGKLVNVSNEVDEDYRVNFVKSKNLLDLQFLQLITNSSGTVISNNGYWNVIIDTRNINSLYVSGNFSLLADNTIRVGTYSSYPVLGSTGTRLTLQANGTINTSNVNYVLLAFGMASSSITIDQVKASFMINEGSTALPYEPFVENKIVVDNEKYSDTLNVGTEVDSRSRVNVLYSKNLFDKNNVNSLLGYFTSQVSVITGTGSGVKILYIPCKPNTTYTVKKVASKRFSLGTTRTTPAVGVAYYDGVFGTTTTTELTITTDSQAQYLIVEYYVSAGSSPDTLSETQILSSIIINEGTIVVDTPSIYVDNEEIYSKPVVERGEVTWNTTNVSGSSTSKKWYKIGNIVIVSFEFTPLSGKIANGNVICTGLPKPQSNFYFSDSGRQFFVSTSGNVAWYYPTNTSDLTRIDITFVYVVE